MGEAHAGDMVIGCYVLAIWFAASVLTAASIAALFHGAAAGATITATA
jgi:hypothetical protein